MRGNFYILLVSPDEHQSSIYASKIKERFGELPLQVHFATDGAKALEKFEKFFHHLVICDINMPVMDGPSLVRDIRKIEGSSVIFLLGEKKPDIDEPGLEFVKIPVVNWTEFVGKVEDVIPEEIKIEYGLTKRDTALNRRLNEFSEKFLKDNNIESESEGEKDISLIPQYFYSEGEAQGGSTGESTQEMSQTHGGRGTFPLALKVKFIVQGILELLILGGLLYYTIKLFNAPPAEDADFSEGNPFINLKNIMALLTTFSFLGYFFSKAFEKFFLKNEKK
ncbi:MAG: response regulator [Bdellovibrionota bacterium]|nr:response regulator [Bdellovibrionota bacterium]